MEKPNSMSSKLGGEEEYVQYRWSMLRDLVDSNLERAYKFLYTVNGGGCVALLAFIGGASEASNKSILYLTLAFFFTGLMTVGFLAVNRTIHSVVLFNDWTDKKSDYNSKFEDLDDLIEEQSKLVKTKFDPVLLIRLSFACTLIAGLTSIASLL